MHEDITISNVQSHMHRRGVGFAAMVTGQAPFYENTAWSNVVVKTFEPGMQVAAGSTLDYYCDYQNGEDRTVYQGAKSTDEMCMLIGSYYPADNRTSNCLDESGANLAGEWVGEGTATCAETMACVAAIPAEAQGSLDPITDCMLAADPKLSRETSALLLCFLSSGDPVNDCAAQIETCQGM